MVTGKQNILNWFEDTKMPYWTIFYMNKTSSGQPVMKSSDDEGLTATEGLVELTNQLDRTSVHGKFTIKAHPKPELTSKGVHQVDIELLRSDAVMNPQVLQTPAITGIPKDQVQEMITAALREQDQKYELRDLKKQVVELQKENKRLSSNEPMNRLAGLAATYFPAIFPVAKVAGIPTPSTEIIDNDHIEENDEETTELVSMSAEDQERVQRALGVFASLDPDGWVDKIEMLAAKLSENPAMMNFL